MLRWQRVISSGPNFSAAACATIDTGDGGAFSRMTISVERWIRLSVFDVIEELRFPVQRHGVHPLIRFDWVRRDGRMAPRIPDRPPLLRQLANGNWVLNLAYDH
jgi:hypothetical protein